MQDFDLFLHHFKNIVENKEEGRKDARQERAIQ